MSNQKQALLETQVDWLETELSTLHKLLQQCGFPNGLASLKQALTEVLKSREEQA